MVQQLHSDPDVYRHTLLHLRYVSLKPSPSERGSRKQLTSHRFSRVCRSTTQFPRWYFAASLFPKLVSVYRVRRGRSWGSKNSRLDPWHEPLQPTMMYCLICGSQRISFLSSILPSLIVSQRVEDSLSERRRGGINVSNMWGFDEKPRRDDCGKSETVVLCSLRVRTEDRRDVAKP